MRVPLIACAAVCLAAFSGCRARPSYLESHSVDTPYPPHGTVRADPPPPVPHDDAVYFEPRPDHVWSEGYWAPTAETWEWRSGGWVGRRPGQVYQQGHWGRDGDSYVWKAPRWVPDREQQVWARGYWRADDAGWRWTPGRWEPHRPGHRWVPGYWRRQGAEQVWEPGYWKQQD